MQGSEEHQCKGIIEGGSLIEAGFGGVNGRLARRQGPVELVVCFAAEWVEYEEGSHVGDVRTEAAVLGIGIVLVVEGHLAITSRIRDQTGCAYNLPPRDPPRAQPACKFVVSRVGSFN